MSVLRTLADRMSALHPSKKKRAPKPQVPKRVSQPRGAEVIVTCYCFAAFAYYDVPFRPGKGEAH